MDEGGVGEVLHDFGLADHELLGEGLCHAIEGADAGDDEPDGGLPPEAYAAHGGAEVVGGVEGVASGLELGVALVAHEPVESFDAAGGEDFLDFVGEGVGGVVAIDVDAGLGGDVEGGGEEGVIDLVCGNGHGAQQQEDRSGEDEDVFLFH